ncbi:hypothetical protein SAMN05444920_11735 [Nonomuraea solani]|uniref:Uncharacterized protein n=1 Tax=Nonomuraea solani TaxID=1144553 RepID=A0A1H6EV85_9ACTN|nr:hypothetical protein [Nonomuraea solani]SEH00604.1 hypothetical protein SAMN05444920_11735 [Nonomuraea solani]
MSHKRSGLLPGLLAGLLAGLVCAAGLGTAVLFQQSLPGAVMAFGGGLPVSLALSLLIAVLVALAIGAVRPRSLVLLPFAALYAGGAVVAGQMAGSAVMIGAALRAPADERAPADLGDVTLANFNGGLPDALSLYSAPLSETWAAWLYIAVAALAALVLVALRVTRVRRAQRTEAAAEEEESQEPEYRAPFEPAQQPSPKPTTDLFAPRNPARD